ncbi:hypothetical protein Tco_0475821 [Tanacetum coccineum]
MKSSRKSTDLTANTPYYSRPIRCIQDFDESKDHCPTLKNMPYPHQYIRRILYFWSNIKKSTLSANTSYPRSSIRRTQDVQYAVPNEPIRRTGVAQYAVPNRSDTPYPIVSLVGLAGDPRINEYVSGLLVYKEPLSNTYNCDRISVSRLEEEKARRHGKVYYREIATYGKIWDNEDVHDLGSVETEFPSRPREGNIDEYVLYKVEDIATYLVEYVKFWDDWGVDRYGNANLEGFYPISFFILMVVKFEWGCDRTPMSIPAFRVCMCASTALLESNYGVFGEVMLKGTHFGAKVKSSRKSTDLIANTPYYSRPIRRIQDFDESKDHCMTLKNTPICEESTTITLPLRLPAFLESPGTLFHSKLFDEKFSRSRAKGLVKMYAS